MAGFCDEVGDGGLGNGNQEISGLGNWIVLIIGGNILLTLS